MNDKELRHQSVHSNLRTVPEVLSFFECNEKWSNKTAVCAFERIAKICYMQDENLVLFANAGEFVESQFLSILKKYSTTSSEVCLSGLRALR